MLPPSSRSIVFDLVMPSFFSASSNVSQQSRGGVLSALPGPLQMARRTAARVKLLNGGGKIQRPVARLLL
jgi:hypothetical protein